MDIEAVLAEAQARREKLESMSAEDYLRGFPRVAAAYPWLAEFPSAAALERGVSWPLQEIEETLGKCERCPGLDGCQVKLAGSPLVLRRATDENGEPRRERDGSPVVTWDFTMCGVRRKAELEAKREAAIDSLHLPPRLTRVLWRGPLEESPAVKAAREWAAGLPEGGLTADGDLRRGDVCGAPGLVFVGPVGTGKSVALAVALVEAARRTLQGGRYWPVAQLLEAMRPAGDREPEVTVEEIAEVPLLALDDLGAERPTDWVLERLDLLFDMRYEALLPTVVATNLSRRELEEVLGSRIVSRLLHEATVVKVQGRDRRRGGRCDD
ncbi:MAG: ATP-binding protein [Bacillota bacterium]